MKKLFFILGLLLIITLNTRGQTAGNSMVFDGINDFVMVPNHASLNPGNGSWTISLWIKPLNEIRRSPLIIKRLPSGGYNQYSLGIADTNAHNPLPGKRFYMNYIGDVGISERSGHTADEFVDGNWHHLALVADKSIDSILFYVDGIKQNTIIRWKLGAWPNVSNLDSLFIGHNNVTSFYKGEMDELSIWNKALTSAQIITLTSDTLGPAYYSTTDSGLVGYWRFNQYENLGIGGGGVDDIRDFSVWGNHGDSEGNPQLVPSGILHVKIINQNYPENYTLFQNYPNPFNPTTTIRFTISDFGFTILKIYNASGKEVATLVNEKLSTGSYEVEFNITQNSILSSGVYFYRLEAGEYAETRKMVLLR